MALTPQFGSLVPTQTQQLLASNYLQFNTGQGADFAQQYLPEIYEQEVERYGNRTLSGFLRMVGAEMPMTSDQVIWSEQNRLHISYDSCTLPGAGLIQVVAAVAGGATQVNQNVISINDTVVILDTVTGAEQKGIVTDSLTAIAGGRNGTIAVTNWDGTVGGAGLTNGSIKVFVYGSAYAKGTSMVNGGTVAAGTQPRVSAEPQLTQYSNSPIIIRSQYTVSGSDMAQIGWVEVATEDGTSGYLWYLKAESETRLRFEDYLEMSLIEGEYSQIGAALVLVQVLFLVLKVYSLLSNHVVT